jgi:hypothetical protein
MVIWGACVQAAAVNAMSAPHYIDRITRESRLTDVIVRMVDGSDIFRKDDRLETTFLFVHNVPD